MSGKILILGSVIILTKSWVEKIFFFNFWLGVSIILVSLLLILISEIESKYYKLLFLVIYSLVLFFQFQTTDRVSLFSLDTNQQILQQQRLTEYPQPHFNLLKNRIYLFMANIFELRKESIVIRNLQINLAQIIDPNFYFFANHPREVIGIPNIEKFFFLLIAPFFIGFYFLIKDFRQYKFVFISLITPIILLTIIGHNNHLGPFSLIPVMMLTITLGILKVIRPHKFL